MLANVLWKLKVNIQQLSLANPKTWYRFLFWSTELTVPGVAELLWWFVLKTALCHTTLKRQMNLFRVDLIKTLMLLETSPTLPSGLVCRTFKSVPRRYWLKESQLWLFKPGPSQFVPLNTVGSQPRALLRGAGSKGRKRVAAGEGSSSKQLCG